MPSGATPFFIVGSPRSGTTLLVRMLNVHSRIFVPPETAFFRALWFESNGTAANVHGDDVEAFAAAYAQWRPLRLLGISPDELIALARRSPTHDAFFMQLMGWLGERAGRQSCTLIGEKSPVHLHHVGLIRQLFPKARFIATVRDGRAVVASRMKHPHWNSNLVTFSREWVKDSRTIRRLRSWLAPEDYLEVRYEDLVKAPEQGIRRVCEFLEADFEPGMLRHHEEAGAGFDDYYQQPWMKKSMTAIDPSRAEAWCAELNGHALSLVERIMRQELLDFGYRPALTAPGLPICLWLKEHARDIAFRAVRRLRRQLRPM